MYKLIYLIHLLIYNILHVLNQYHVQVEHVVQHVFVLYFLIHFQDLVMFVVYVEFLLLIFDNHFVDDHILLYFDQDDFQNVEFLHDVFVHLKKNQLKIVQFNLIFNHFHQLVNPFEFFLEFLLILILIVFQY